MPEVKQCIICGSKGEITEDGPCRHLRTGPPKHKYQLPTGERDYIGCPSYRLAVVPDSKSSETVTNRKRVN